MNHIELINDLIDEISYRSAKGYPDFKNPKHISLVSEILVEWGYPELVDGIISSLLNEETEEEKNFKNKILDKTVKYKDENGEQKEGKVGNLLRLGKDTAGRKAAEKMMPADKDERKEVLKDLGAENSPEDGSEDGGDGSQSPEGPDPAEIKATFADKETQQRYKDEKDAASGNENNQSVQLEKITKNYKVEPSNGKLSDGNDPYSDGETKEKMIRGEETAPGNASSKMAEVMAGEVFSYLDKNPNLTDQEIADMIYDQLDGTSIADDVTKGSTDTFKTGDKAGKYKELISKSIITAKIGKKKWKRTSDGIDELESQGKFKKPVNTRNFWGAGKSKEKQIELISSISGKIYTRSGVEISKEEISKLINDAGGGSNPSDTSTITVDKNGNAMVEFHSDKLTTADIQANSTPSAEYDEAIKYVNDLTDVSGVIRDDSTRIINESKKQLNQIEESLKQVATGPSIEMLKGDIGKLLSDAKNDVLGAKLKTSTKIQKSLYSRGKPHPKLQPYLDATSPTEEELLKALLSFSADADADGELTADQSKLLSRLSKSRGFDTADQLNEIRIASLQLQRDTHNKLNEKTITLANGDTKPLGDYIESKNLISKLHLDVIDGDKSHGVGKYDGLFNLNMGGTVIDANKLKESLGVDNSDDFISHFEMGSPGDGDEYTKNKKTGQITGRNVFVYAVTKDGVKTPIAFKTQRSKQGAQGKLNTTYQWTPEMQKKFKQLG